MYTTYTTFTGPQQNPIQGEMSVDKSQVTFNCALCIGYFKAIGKCG